MVTCSPNRQQLVWVWPLNVLFRPRRIVRMPGDSMNARVVYEVAS
jgi:hypothetical protein